MFQLQPYNCHHLSEGSDPEGRASSPKLAQRSAHGKHVSSICRLASISITDTENLRVMTAEDRHMEGT